MMQVARDRGILVVPVVRGEEIELEVPARLVTDVLAEQLLLRLDFLVRVVLVLLRELLQLGLQLLHFGGAERLLAAQREHAAADEERQQQNAHAIVRHHVMEPVQQAIAKAVRLDLLR